MFFRRHKNLTDQQRESHVRDRRVHLASERTFLAWIRTAVSIMAFGVVVDKFIIFDQQNAARQGIIFQDFGIITDIIGIFIVMLGCLTGILATIRYIKMEKEIEKGHFSHSVVFDLLFTAVLLTLAAFLAIYLLNTRLIIGGS